MIRYHLLEQYSFLPLALLAKKVRGEIKYHVFHANTWVTQLGAQGNDESHNKMQAALDMAFPLALGMFEPSKFEQELIDEGVFAGENELQRLWMESITTTLAKATLTIPTNCNPSYGGLYG